MWFPTADGIQPKLRTVNFRALFKRGLSGIGTLCPSLPSPSKATAWPPYLILTVLLPCPALSWLPALFHLCSGGCQPCPRLSSTCRNPTIFLTSAQTSHLQGVNHSRLCLYSATLPLPSMTCVSLVTLSHALASPVPLCPCLSAPADHKRLTGRSFRDIPLSSGPRCFLHQPLAERVHWKGLPQARCCCSTLIFEHLSSWGHRLEADCL